MKGAAVPVKVLFICVGNACRSPMAEAIARRDASDVIEAASAGLAPMGSLSVLTKRTLEANGCSAGGLVSKGISAKSWEAAELVINMSGRAREFLFADWGKVEDWKVQDPYGADPALYQRIFEEIESRVGELARRMRLRKEKQEA